MKSALDPQYCVQLQNIIVFSSLPSDFLIVNSDMLFLWYCIFGAAVGLFLSSLTIDLNYLVAVA